MLLFNEILNSLPIGSVQASNLIGVATGPIIDPRNLTILALRVQPNEPVGERILFTADIRQLTTKGAIIDHDDQLMEDDGLVRLKEVTDLKFELIGKRVETEDGQKLGSVGRYVFNAEGWTVSKLHINPSLGKSLKSSGLIIDRQQVVKVTDNRIIVKSTAVKSGSGFSLKKLFLGETKPALNPETAESGSSEISRS